jgi:Rieske Fe-S protein
MRGSWTRTMRARDWKAAGSGYPVGTWRFDVAKDGGVDVYYPRKTAVDFTTQYSVAGRTLTIDSIPVCPGQTGRYAWRAAGNTLTLSRAGHDTCVQRVALFGGTWHRRH